MKKLAAAATALAVLGLAQGAWAEVGGASRPRGFALELEIAGSSNIVTSTLGGLAGWGFSYGGVTPRLFLGGQLGRFSIGGQLGMVVRHNTPDATSWGMTLGPKFDYEVWTSGPGGLYIAGALPMQIVGADGGYSAAGFGFDFGLGGRVIMGRWLLASVQAGTRLDVLFWDDAGPDDASLAWGFYGSIALRYVASR